MFAIRRFDKSDRDYEAIVDISNAVWPDELETVDELKYRDEVRDCAYLFQRLVVEEGDRIIASGIYCEPEWSHVPGKYFIYIQVHPDQERRGIGTTLYDHIVGVVAERDPATFASGTREDKPQAIRFLTQRGYRQVMREQTSRLDLASFDPTRFTDVRARVREMGIRIHSAAELASIDPDWKRKVWDLEWELLQDVPSTDPVTRQKFENFVKWFDAPTFLPDAYLIAIKDGEYIGMTSLWLRPGQKGKLYTELTGVVRSLRRNGIATAIKVQAIARAKERGAKTIETDNEENNPMYALNTELGFRPTPGWLDFRKPAASDIGGQ